MVFMKLSGTFRACSSGTGMNTSCLLVLNAFRFPARTYLMVLSALLATALLFLDFFEKIRWDHQTLAARFGGSVV